ncbi:MAG: HAMP domain-containing protein, partial [Chloroflexota bacterium]
MRWLFQGGLQRKVVLLVGAFTLVALGVLWVSSSLAVQESIERTLQERLLLAQTIAGHLDYILSQNLGRLQDVAFYPGVDLADADAGPEQKALHEAYIQSIFSDGVFLTNGSGVVILTQPYDSGMMGADLSSQDFVQQALGQGKPVVSGLYTLGGQERPSLTAVVPIKSREGRIVGLAGGNIDPTQGNLIQAIQPAAPTGYGIEVVDHRGMVLAATNPALLLTYSDHGDTLASLIRRRETVVSRCHSCHQAGQPPEIEVMAFAPLASAAVPWGVTVRQTEAAALAPASQLQRRFLLSGAFLLVLGFAIAWGMAQGIVRPVVGLTREAQRIADGSLETPVAVQGGGEIGTLASAFETMRQRLRDSLEQSRRWGQELESRVQER